MIDTINFYTQDFEYDHQINMDSKYPLLNFHKPVKNGYEEYEQPLILTDTTGTSFYGSSLNLAGNPINGTGILKIGRIGKDDIASLSLSLSAPKFLGYDERTGAKGNNFYLAQKGDMQLLKKQIVKKLREIGINLDIDNAKIGRLDLTRNAETDYNFPTYLPILKAQKCNRSKTSEINAETYTVGSQNRKVCCYDKIAEEQNNNTPLPYGITKNMNILRCESRALNSKAVRTLTNGKITTFQDLIKEYDILESVYKKNVTDKLFTRESFKEIQGDICNMEQIVSSCYAPEETISKVSRRIFDTLLVQQTIRILEDISIQDIVEIIMEQVYLSKDITPESARQKKSRYTRELTQRKAELLSLKLTNTISLASLYNELYEKLLCA